MKIYAFSGLGADERVFSFLNLDHEIIPLTWIQPKEGETISKYSNRMISHYGLGADKQFGLLGVSFGGLIAVEISKILHPKITILISSAETKNELPRILNVLKKSGIIGLLPKRYLKPPKWVAKYVFGTEKVDLLTSIIDDSDSNFNKWALSELMKWDNEKQIPNVLKIGGSKDKIIPQNDEDTFLIKNGQHFMIVDRADEISELINKKIEGSLNNSSN